MKNWMDKSCVVNFVVLVLYVQAKMLRLLLILALTQTVVCETEQSLDELIADIFGTELTDNDLDDQRPPGECAALEGRAPGCQECYYCNDTRVTDNRRRGRPVTELQLKDSTCSPVRICCVAQTNVLGLRSRGDCGKSNPDGKPRKRRPAVRAVLQGEFPWRAWVYKKNTHTPLCAATFVHENSKALLTLASCVSGMRADGVEVSFAKEGRRSAVQNIIPHGSYRAGEDVNNIAILQLRSLESIPEWAAPACLPGASPAHAAPCLTTSPSDVRLNTVIPLRKACFENKTDPPPELTCATAPHDDYDPETAAGLYCRELHVTRPAFILQGIAIKRLDDAVTSYVNVWHFTDWIRAKLRIDI